MKLKFALLTALLMMAGVASAQSSATVSYGVKDTDASPSVQSHILNLSVKTRAFTNVDVDGAILTDTTDSKNVITNRYEIGVTPFYNINESFRGDVRVATGVKTKSGSNDFGYYSVEPGVTGKLGDFSARVAYRFRTAYDSAVNADTSQTMRYSVGYAITKKDAIRLGYDVQSGDGANKQTTIAYTRSF